MKKIYKQATLIFDKVETCDVLLTSSNGEKIFEDPYDVKKLGE